MEDKNLVPGSTVEEKMAFIHLRVSHSEVPRVQENIRKACDGIESREDVSFLPSYSYHLLLEPGLPLGDQWKTFNEARNPEMPLEMGVEKLIIENLTRIGVLKGLGFTLPLQTPSVETEWKAVESEGMQAFYLGAPNNKNVCLVRTSWKRPDGKILLVENLACVPSEEALEQSLREGQEKPSVISSSPR